MPKRLPNPLLRSCSDDWSSLIVEWPRTLKWIGLVAFVLGFAMSGAMAHAQQAKKIYRIGSLGAASASSGVNRREAFRQGLRELGYVEGKNIFIEQRFAEGKPERLFGLAAELAHLNVDVIVTGGSNQPVLPRKRQRRFP